ncbi:MAG: methionine-S-sulfoxide reductase [Alteromonadaceae bacterium]|jgi:methionine-S-sulfoxide reductase
MNKSQTAPSANPATNSITTTSFDSPGDNKSQHATFGGGCFWCLDAIFREIQGIETINSGFSGGIEPDPSYELACSGQTGHAEVIHIKFDPTLLSYQSILSIFFAAHDPTQLNRQGHDVGPQYRSVIFFHNQQQQQTAHQLITAIDEQALWTDKIVTELTPFDAFYTAPEQHQNFYQKRTTVPYCQIIIHPKLVKIRQLFGQLLI